MKSISARDWVERMANSVASPTRAAGGEQAGDNALIALAPITAYRYQPTAD